MVKMCVGQKYGVYALRSCGKGLAVAGAQVLEALEQATIHQDATGSSFNQVARTGDSACRTEKPKGMGCRPGHAVIPSLASVLNKTPMKR